MLGSTKLEDYPPIIPKIRSYTDNYTERSLIYGEDLEQISLLGRGVIDGQGSAFKGEYKVRRTWCGSSGAETYQSAT